VLTSLTTLGVPLLQDSVLSLLSWKMTIVWTQCVLFVRWLTTLFVSKPVPTMITAHNSAMKFVVTAMVSVEKLNAFWMLIVMKISSYLLATPHLPPLPSLVDGVLSV
jgi:hypothetical protein